MIGLKLIVLLPLLAIVQTIAAVAPGIGYYGSSNVRDQSYNKRSIYQTYSTAAPQIASVSAPAAKVPPVPLTLIAAVAARVNQQPPPKQTSKVPINTTATPVYVPTTATLVNIPTNVAVVLPETTNIQTSPVISNQNPSNEVFREPQPSVVDTGSGAVIDTYVPPKPQLSSITTTAVTNTIPQSIPVPNTSQPTTPQPTTPQPTTPQPTTPQPTPSNTGSEQNPDHLMKIYSTPFPSNPSDIIMHPSTQTPTYPTQPSTYSTEPPRTLLPVTLPPATAAPTTAPSVTAASITHPTLPPRTLPPATLPSITAAPPTAPPVTAAPITPPTLPPRTPPPVTLPPTTTAPPTALPVTAAPITWPKLPPRTPPPVTLSPTTAAPPTVPPVTAQPTYLLTEGLNTTIVYVSTEQPPTTESGIIQGYNCQKANGYFSVTNKCDSYVECKENIAVRRICPDGLHFNPKSKYPEYPCAYPVEVQCTAGLVAQTPIPTSQCANLYGFYPMSNGDCSKYIVCQDGIANIMSCPPGLVFNKNIDDCDWPINVPSCNLDIFKGFKCPSQPDSDLIEKFRFKGSCTSYVACQRGHPRLLSCDYGLRYEEATQSCVDASKVKDCTV